MIPAWTGPSTKARFTPAIGRAVDPRPTRDPEANRSPKNVRGSRPEKEPTK